MKKVLALGVAAVIGLGSLGVATTVTPANADPGQNWNQDWKFKNGQRGNWLRHSDNRGNNWQYNRGNHWNGKWSQHRGYRGSPILPLIIGGAIGYGIGSAYSAPSYSYDSGPSYRYSQAHVQWCLERYPNTYNPATNRYFSRPGVQAVCYSPYYG